MNGLNPALVSVQMFAEGGAPQGYEAQQMELTQQLQGEVYAYTCAVSDHRPASDYTPRIIPSFNGANVPLEENLILWRLI